MTLVEFLRARLDEDEQAARDATSGEWTALDGGVQATDHLDDDGYPNVWPVSLTESPRDRQDRVHIARHDPARVLREVAAKRRIVDLLTLREQIADQNRPAPDATHTFHDGVAAGLEEALAVLAEAYADHPEYREEWRP